jgi:hypothetical protein
MKFLNNLKNSFDFFIRQRFPISRVDFYQENEAKDNLFTNEVQREREAYLCEKYDLYDLKNNSTCAVYLENLYFADVFDNYFDIGEMDEASVLDIGSKNWSYVTSEYKFFRKFCSVLTLRGIELDCNRLYSNFYSRKEVAKYYIKKLSDTEFICGDFLKHYEKYDYITWFLPFVFESPLCSWGLPSKYFLPERMLNHAVELLKNNSKIFIVNQGEEEYLKQIELCKNLALNFIPIGKIESVFQVFKNDRFLIKINSNSA